MAADAGPGARPYPAARRGARRCYGAATGVFSRRARGGAARRDRVSLQRRQPPPRPTAPSPMSARAVSTSGRDCSPRGGASRRRWGGSSSAASAATGPRSPPLRASTRRGAWRLPTAWRRSSRTRLRSGGAPAPPRPAMPQRQAPVETVGGLIKPAPGCRPCRRRGRPAVPGAGALGGRGGHLQRLFALKGSTRGQDRAFSRKIRTMSTGHAPPPVSCLPRPAVGTPSGT